MASLLLTFPRRGREKSITCLAVSGRRCAFAPRKKPHVCRGAGMRQPRIRVKAANCRYPVPLKVKYSACTPSGMSTSATVSRHTLA